MKLDDAIKHANERVEACRLVDGAKSCGDDHQQLSDWLKELQYCRLRVEELEEELIRRDQYIATTPFLNSEEREMVLYTFQHVSAATKSEDLA